MKRFLYPMVSWVPAAVLMGAVSASAAEVVLNFDNVVSGSPANRAALAGLTFEPAVWAPRFEVDGTPVAGSESWRVDGSAPSVTVDDPSTFGRGAAPTGLNALNALWQPVLVQFAAPQLIRQFSVTLDNDGWGGRGLSVEFYDGANRLLGQLAVDQTVPGFSISAPALDLAEVSSIVLPAGAFYDRLAVSSVPEPAPILLAALGGLWLIVGCRWDRRSAGKDR